MENNSNMTTTLVVAVVVAVVAGFVGYTLGTGNESKTTTKQESTSMEAMKDDSHDHSAESGLESTLTRLFTEHVDLALNATRSGYDGSADFEAVAAQLDENSVAIAGAIESVYGPEAGSTFLAEWRNHINFFVDYTVATKAGDEAAQNAAVAGLMGYIETSATFLSEANPNLDKEVLVEGFTTHITQLKNSVDAYAAGDYEQAYSLQSDATAHMQGTANLLATAIIDQFPDKF